MNLKKKPESFSLLKLLKEYKSLQFYSFNIISENPGAANQSTSFPQPIYFSEQKIEIR